MTGAGFDQTPQSEVDAEMLTEQTNDVVQGLRLMLEQAVEFKIGDGDWQTLSGNYDQKSSAVTEALSQNNDTVTLKDSEGSVMEWG